MTEGTRVASVVPTLTLVILVEGKSTSVGVGDTDTISLVSLFGLDSLIGIPGDVVVISIGSPLAVVVLLIGMGVRVDIVFECNAKDGVRVNSGISTGVLATAGILVLSVDSTWFRGVGLSVGLSRFLDSAVVSGNKDEDVTSAVELVP